MNNMLLAKPELPHGTIDCSVGEPHIVRDNLLKVFSLTPYELPQVDHMYEYPNPRGYKPLVKLLEDKHQAPVIITSGAKQALGASFYALKQMGKQSLKLRTPFWALLPPLINMHGLATAFDGDEYDSYLCVAPNNPDGETPSLQSLKEFANVLKEQNIPLIHDAAYFTHTYLPETYKLGSFGDAQIYSFSKSLGLSGLRLGYIVCHNEEIYLHCLHYMEAMTVGASIVSQIFLFDLLNRMKGYQTLTQRFEGLSSMALMEAKKIIKQVDPQILEIDPNIENTNGMFLWCKKGDKADFLKSKVNVIDGAHFGAPGYIRMNLAFDTNTMQEIVKRLNSVLEPDKE